MTGNVSITIYAHATRVTSQAVGRNCFSTFIAGKLDAVIPYKTYSLNSLR